MSSKQVFRYSDPFGFISVFKLTALKLLQLENYSILSLAFITSPFMITEEHVFFETVQSFPPFIF